MREIAMKSDTVASIVNSIVDFTSGVKIRCVPRDLSQEPDPMKVERGMKLFTQPNPQMNGLELRKVLARDLATYGYAALEKVKKRGGIEYWPVDVMRFSIDFDEHGTVLGYDQIDAVGQPIKGPDGEHAWEKDEIILFRHDVVSHSEYPISRIEQLFTAAVVENMMLDYIASKFDDNNVPHGVYDLGDMTPDDLNRAIENWNQQADSPHRLVLTGSKGGSKFIDFHADLSRLQAPELLQDVRARILSVFGGTPNELAIAMRENNTETNLTYTFKKRIVEPYNQTIIDRASSDYLDNDLDMSDYVYVFEQIDSKDAQIEVMIQETQAKMGFVTINEIRARNQMPSKAGGDEPYLYTPTGAIPVRLLAPMAQAQLDAVKAATRQALASAKASEASTNAASQSLVTSPTPRTNRPPDRTGNSSGTQIRLPHPNQSSKPGNPGTSTTGVKASPQIKPAHSGAVGEHKSEGTDEETETIPGEEGTGNGTGDPGEQGV